MKAKKKICYLTFMIIMIGLGASDALRGIFSGIFEQHFDLTKTQISMIITVSYIGNLAFMLLGGRLADKFEKKKVCIAIMLLWISGLLIYLFTDNYIALLIGMFFTMGASTLMNTMINLLSGVFFGASAGMIVNTLFFTQGIGTSGSQNLIGRYATQYQDFKIVNGGLLLIGAAGIILLILLPFTKDDHSTASAVKTDIALTAAKTASKSEHIKTNLQAAHGFRSVLCSNAFRYLTLIFGFYFIAEHGILNWWVLYCTQHLSLSTKSAAGYLSLFFGGITVGRLVFAPAVQKLGVSRSITIFGGIGTIGYVAGILLGRHALVLVGLSGFFISILYPTMVLLIKEYFHTEVVTTAAGTIISAATIFDIIFNAVFGKIIEAAGYARGILIFPLSMAAFYLVYQVFIHQRTKNK